MTRHRGPLVVAVVVTTLATAAVVAAGATIGRIVDGTDDASTGAPVVAPTRSTSDPAATRAETSPFGISTLADPAWVAETARWSGIPTRALAAYAGAAIEAARTHPECGIGWNMLAAIGFVESEHGTIGGSAIGGDGVARPAIIGIALDGTSTERISDTDDGDLDGDARWDRAVGPMQFLPSTWAVWGRDGNGDGRAEIHQIDDAALAAAEYLCAAGGDLTSGEGWIDAVTAYNRSVEYNDRVAEAAAFYAGGG